MRHDEYGLTEVQIVRMKIISIILLLGYDLSGVKVELIIVLILCLAT